MPQVTIYGRAKCAPCKTVKYFLTKKGIPFTDLDIDNDELAMAEYSRLSPGPVVPLIVIGDRQIAGMNLSLLSKMLMV
jgi:glutaredoxin